MGVAAAKPWLLISQVHSQLNVSVLLEIDFATVHTDYTLWESNMIEQILMLSFGKHKFTHTRKMCLASYEASRSLPV